MTKKEGEIELVRPSFTDAFTLQPPEDPSMVGSRTRFLINPAYMQQLSHREDLRAEG